MTTKAPKQATEADRTIGSRLAALRSAQGLSQTALGAAIGVSFQQVQKYEKGRNRIGAGRLRAIADLLPVPVETFFLCEPTSVAGLGDVQAFFDDPQLMELVAAYRDITDEGIRSSVLSIVKTAAIISKGQAE
ncbi:helix-turn-helix transcriptional regulator [Methylobacterium sp. SI9]|uniref:helix-turn-helix domain-containing protein n=1 Tax=Methylobacterium guangdongense TaxID=3138811 RepID=UPI00313DF968